MKLNPSKGSVILLFLVAFIAVIGCGKDPSKMSDEEIEKEKYTGEKKSYRNGKLYSILHFKEGKKHGLGKTFYEDGTVHMEMNYTEGKKDGVGKMYYQSGKLYMETTYKEGKKEGKQKKFYENGQVSTLLTWKDDCPCNDLVEYYQSGKKKTKPKLVFREKNTVILDYNYEVTVSLDPKNRTTEYYFGELDEDGCFTKTYYQFGGKGSATKKYTVSKGAYLVDKLVVVAKAKTRLRNPLVLAGSFNIAVDHY